MILNLTIFYVLLAIFIEIECDKPILRGIDPQRAQLYVNKKDRFTCLDGKKEIKYTQLNDDFCDCIDGSDEPGTAACTYGQFYCVNAGFKPLIVPSSRVNDGLCDCCDGSDEYFSNAKCINNCMELGSADRLREMQEAEIFKSGNQIRLEMSQKGKKMREEQKARLADLEKSKDQAEKIKEEKYNLKTEAELLENAALDVYRKAEEEERKLKESLEAESNRAEAEEIFKKYDSNNNGRIELIELQTRIAFDKDRNGVVDEEEARYFLDNNDEMDYESFITLAWPKIKPFLMLDSGLFKPPRKEGEEETENVEVDPAIDEEMAELQNEEDEHHEDDQDFEEETGEGEVVNDSPAPTPQPQYDDDTQKLIHSANEARNQYTVADREFREIDRELSDIRGAIEKDFGPEDEFVPLYGECFTYEDREYIYKFCPFDKAIQQPKNGGAETRLGTWDSWKGNDYRKMFYGNGAGCWNGPARSAIVDLSCGLDTRILDVSEPNRCEYHFKVQSPAVCFQSQSSTTHDEL